MYTSGKAPYTNRTADQWNNYEDENEDDSDDYVHEYKYFAGGEFFDDCYSNIFTEEPASSHISNSGMPREKIPNCDHQKEFNIACFPSSYPGGMNVRDDCQQNSGNAGQFQFSRSSEDRVNNQNRPQNDQNVRSEHKMKTKNVKGKSMPKERRRGNRSKPNKRTNRQKLNNYEDHYHWPGLKHLLSDSNLLAFGWLLLDLLKTALGYGFEKFVDIIPTALNAGYAVVWYISVLLVLSTSLLCSMCYFLLLNLPTSFLDKIKNIKEGCERIFKKKETSAQHHHQEQCQENEHNRTAENSDELISRLLDSRFESAYNVLGVSESATDEDIKRKYREAAKVVHPDKNTHPESGQAFQILQAAFEKINTEENRAEYQMVRDKEKFEDQFDDFLDLMKQRVNELKKRMFCSVCGETHPRLLTDRLVHAARYCGQCNIKHSAKDGDVWVETSHMGFKYYCYLCMDDQVFEVTEWASCQGLLRARANTHAVYISVKPNRPSYSPWDDSFGESDHPNQTNQNPKKKRNKSKIKSTTKKKK